MIKTSHIRRVKGFWGIMLMAGVISLICPCSAMGKGELKGWQSLSLRKPRIENVAFDYEWCSGVEDKYSEISWLYEREDGEKYRGVFFKHDKDWLKVQYYYKEANFIDNLSIITKTKKEWKKIKCDYGACYLVDWSNNVRTFMSYTKVYQKNWFLNWQTSATHNVLEFEYYLKDYKGFTPKLLYYRMDDNYFWQMKLVWKFKIV